jgi:GrpB-like predicted nucleotidyltransferase (UPF0157 family)/GNAT superfamily N-acetyltransferase
MHIRRAVADDAEPLSALVLRAKAHWGYSKTQLQAWRSDLEVSAEFVSAHPTFVGELNGLMIGFYSLTPAAAAWDLDNLWVLPSFMNKGFGRALLMHATHTAAAAGATSILIESDPNAEAFYLACGAKRIGAVAAPIPGELSRVRPRLTLAVACFNLDEPVDVVEYEAVWPKLFDVERKRLAAELAVRLNQIEHIGSTAVPGLVGKPIIDMMLGVDAWPPAEAITHAIGRLGYECLGEAGVPERMYFRRRGSVNCNLHVVRLCGRHWVANIALREYLRSHESARERYSEAKRSAIASGANTLLAYSQAKAQTLSALLNEAITPNDSCLSKVLDPRSLP